MRFNEQYANHKNLLSGATGPSSGSTNFTFVGTSLKFERNLSDDFGIGLAPGLGALNMDLGGSFFSGGTRPAITGEFYGFYKLNENLHIVPSIQLIQPLGKFDGGAGAVAVSPVEVGLIKKLSLGVRMQF